MAARARRHRAVARRAGLALAAGLLAAPAVTPAQAPVTDSSDLAARLERLERSMNTGTLVDLLERVEALSREVRDLRGQVELQGHELGQLKERQRELYLDLDGRLQRIEQGGAPVAAGDGTATGEVAASPPTGTTTATPEPQTPSTATAPTQPAVDPLSEQSDYQAAFNLLKEARYDAAASALIEFLAKYPDGAYADNAQYWLGESFYVTRRFPEALAEFEKLVARFPDSQKYTHALLKVGYIHDKLGDRAARRVLEDLVARFPGSAAAGLAKKRLERLQ